MKIQITAACVQTDFQGLISGVPVQFQRFLGLPANRLIGQVFDMGTDEARLLIAQGAAVSAEPVKATPLFEPEPVPDPPKRTRGRK